MQSEKIYRATIPKLAAIARHQMLKLSYSETTIFIYDRIWNDLKDYAEERHIDYFDQEVAMEFSDRRYAHMIGDPCVKGDPYTKKTVTRAMQCLLDIDSFGVVFDSPMKSKYQWHPCFRTLLDSFITDRMSKQYADSTLVTVKSCLQGLETFLLQKDVRIFSEVTEQHIQAFILTFSRYARSTLGNRMFYLKSLLEYAFLNGYHSQNLAVLCPKIPRNKTLNHLPSTFTEDEIKRILKAVDRANPCGKRDYAMLLMVVRLGLRSVDIRNLKFENINWGKKEITLTQSKTNLPLSLPLLDDVGWAIIDYLRDGRPDSGCTHIFIRHIPPYTELAHNPYAMFQRYLTRAGISCEHERRHGLHALRHSLASQLLEESIPLPVISDVLGHTCIDTTMVYLKIDLPQLRKCALEVPSWQ